MVNNCANPKCSKPLHYLRDGRVFVFEVAGARLGPDGKRTRHLEHYWLCGDCSPSMTVESNPEKGILIRTKPVQPGAPTLAAFAS
jgi:hypothetical protein